VTSAGVNETPVARRAVVCPPMPARRSGPGRIIRRLLLAVVLLAGWYPVMQAGAHEIRPGLLDIKERDTGWFDVTWKVPMRGDRLLAVLPILPDSLELLGTPKVQTIPGAQIQRATYKSNGEPLTGQTIVIDGLAALQTDVLLAIEFSDGVRHSAILRPGSPEFTITLRASRWEVAGSYWRMGVAHILEGVDHLLFVLALLLIVSGVGPLVKAVTAFTVAHSITLALATLGFVHVPPKPTEAVIALSIVFLATEIVHKHNGQVGLTERYPWLIAFIFGLFHGLGFAGALSEIGVPQHEVPLALFTFNVGVETGQLLFIAAVLALRAVLRRLPLTLPPGAGRLLPYGIGGVAAFWTIDRVLSFTPEFLITQF
jgi:hydrogenase/urease accessory protein HupE